MTSRLILNGIHVALFGVAWWLGMSVVAVMALPLTMSAVFGNLWLDAERDGEWVRAQYEDLAQSVFTSRHAG